jgi:transposase-like protein
MPRKNETQTPQKAIDKFLKRHFEGGESVVALSKEYKISRATAYNWLNKHREKLLEQSRTADMTPAAIEKTARVSLIAENRMLKAENGKLKNKVMAMMLKYGEL